MALIVEVLFSSFMSKVINDGKDYSWAKIKRVINDKNNRNLSTKIYRVIENALNIVTDKRFKDTDKLYEAIEKIFIEFRDNGSTIESVKCALGLLGSDTSDQRCENFLEKFYEGIRQDDDLYKAINMILQQNGIKNNQEEFQNINEKLDNLTNIVSRKNNNIIDIQSRKLVKSRTQEYADKWEANMFLNDFDKRDENAGTNVKLKEVYLEEHLPHYVWYKNSENKPLTDLKDLLSEYINEKRDSKMLLVLGQPGIGKSTLITWITANFNERIDDILVYRFASDLRNIDWTNGRISNRVLEELGLSHSDLNGKTLIIDGFDEVSIESSRRRGILDSLYIDWVNNKAIENFSLIITCRENYVSKFGILKCRYITLQPWDENQIKSFCNIFQEKTKNNISEATIEKLLENKEILGIPLILYMVLALNISIEKEGSIVDIYDKIFSIEGGIYDRCINNKNFDESHRIGAVKESIHQLSREIALWMFENEPDKASILQEEYQKICRNIIQDGNKCKEIEQDFLIGNFFKFVKHCEGIETEEIYFVHRTIYEYFVIENIYSSIENAMLCLTTESQEELAGNIATFIKEGCLSATMCEYLGYKIRSFYNTRLKAEDRKKFYYWWEKTIFRMMDNGMFFYTKKCIQNFQRIISQEVTCFSNLAKIERMISRISGENYIFCYSSKCETERYIKISCIEHNLSYLNVDLDFSIMYLKDINLSGMNLMNSSFVGSNLTDANLNSTDCAFADFIGAKLCNANITDANLINADLRGADLTGADLTNTDLDYSVWDKKYLSPFLPQLKKAKFECIIVEENVKRKKVFRTELFPEEG